MHCHYRLLNLQSRAYIFNRMGKVEDDSIFISAYSNYGSLGEDVFLLLVQGSIAPENMPFKST